MTFAYTNVGERLSLVRQGGLTGTSVKYFGVVCQDPLLYMLAVKPSQLREIDSCIRLIDSVDIKL